jgi:hypothetical protein
MRRPWSPLADRSCRPAKILLTERFATGFRFYEMPGIDSQDFSDTFN